MSNITFAVFLLGFLFIPAILSDDRFIGALTIQIHQRVEGLIVMNGVFDYFQIKLAAQRTYMIAMESVFDNYLTLYDSAGTDLARNDDSFGSNAQIMYESVITGYYYIQAREVYGVGTGTYVLSVEDVSVCSTDCTDCQVVSAVCSICSPGLICTACLTTPASGIIGGACLSACPDLNCLQCTSSGSCESCSNSKFAWGSSCVNSCPGDTFVNGGLCTSCEILDSFCSTCSSLSTCLTCSSSKYALGSLCVDNCPAGTFISGGAICLACQTLDNDCTSCNSSVSCTACSNSRYALGSSCVANCPGDTFNHAGVCTSCKTLDNFCTTCNNSMSCTGCSDSKFALGTKCVGSCPGDTFKNAGICTSCKTLDNYCISCNSSLSCIGCSDSKYALGPKCVESCPGDTFNNAGICSSCKTLDNFCMTCNNSMSCTGCSDSKFALGPKCVESCPFGTFPKEGICTSCKTLDNSCLNCNGTSSCTQCSGILVALGPACVTECPIMTYNHSGICTSCVTLDSSCVSCNSSASCLGCSGGLLAFGSTCTFSCPAKTYDNNGLCLSCKTLDDYCLECSNNRFCSLCDGKMLNFGSNCVLKCPSGTRNTEGVCSNTAYKIYLTYIKSPSSYLAHFSPVLVYEVDILQVSTVILEGVGPEIYNYTLTKKSNTIYQIDFKFTQSIPSTKLKFIYFLNASMTTNNLLIGKWVGEITTKNMGFLSESDKTAVEAINSVVGGAMKGVAAGAGSMAVLGGNPALLWPLLNLFQTFYYLVFIDVSYPANVQMFLKIFSLGSLDFLPNPLEWFVGDIDKYELNVPPRYNDYNFNGLFLENSGNELLLLALVFGLYLVSKVAKKWLRRLPTSVRLFTNKTVGWFEWSGILRSLITSYTDMAQAVFLQMRILVFSSTVFMLSSVLALVALGVVILLPVMIFFIIRGYDDHPELLEIKYDTLVEEYDVKKKAGRYFIPIWLVRRLVMCLSLVFLQGYPYMQINVLCILVIGTIVHSWVYTPYTTKKENVCNTIIEILFGCIHVGIYLLIYDDHNPSFSEKQRLQMGWVIIIACGVILIITMGLSIFEQVKEVIRGIKVLKKLLSKPVAAKNKRRKIKMDARTIITEHQELVAAADQSHCERSKLDIERDSPLGGVTGNHIPRPAPLSELRKLKRGRIARRIHKLRAVNSGK